jgi:hypothetical protein
MLADGFFVFNLTGSMMLMVYYIPIYFQAVKGVSAEESGIRTIPLVLSLVAGSIVSEIATGKIWVLYSVCERFGCRHACERWLDLDVES